jgi:hypothetical protein
VADLVRRSVRNRPSVVSPVKIGCAHKSFWGKLAHYLFCTTIPVEFKRAPLDRAALRARQLSNV